LVQWVLGPHHHLAYLGYHLVLDHQLVQPVQMSQADQVVLSLQVTLVNPEGQGILLVLGPQVLH